MNATLHVRFQIRKGEATQKGIRYPLFTGRTITCLRVRRTASVHCYHRNLSHPGRRRPIRGRFARSRNALLNMIDHLSGRGWSPQQAYAICNVAVDLKISQVESTSPTCSCPPSCPRTIFIRLSVLRRRDLVHERDHRAALD